MLCSHFYSITLGLIMVINLASIGTTPAGPDASRPPLCPVPLQYTYRTRVGIPTVLLSEEQLMEMEKSWVHYRLQVLCVVVHSRR